MQVGPLANILVGYASGHALTRKWTDTAFKGISSVHGLKVVPNDMQSTMGRYLARAIRSAMLSDLALEHLQLLTTNILNGDDTTYNPPQFPSGEVMGMGMHEAPSRCALPLGGHRQRGLLPITRRLCPPRGMQAHAIRTGIPGAV
jgi:hydrogenase large subunit